MPLSLVLTTWLSLSKINLNLHQSIRSSTSINSSLNVKTQLEGNKAEVKLETTNFPSPVVTIIKEAHHVEVKIKTHSDSITQNSSTTLTAQTAKRWAKDKVASITSWLGNLAQNLLKQIRSPFNTLLDQLNLTK